MPMTESIKRNYMSGGSLLNCYEIRYDKRCYCNVRSKADISQFNLPQESVESVLKKKRKATVGRICRIGRF